MSKKTREFMTKAMYSQSDSKAVLVRALMLFSRQNYRPSIWPTRSQLPVGLVERLIAHAAELNGERRPRGVGG